MMVLTYYWISFLTFLVCSINSVTNDATNCDIQLTNGCLFLTPSQFVFSDAQFECYRKNGALAIINSTDLVNAVSIFLNRRGINETFIGLTDRIQRGTFRWNDDSIETNIGLIVQDTIVPQNTEACITQTSDGFWRKSLCNVPNNALCQTIDNTPPKAPVRQWSSWISLSNSSENDQILTIDNLRKTYPFICANPDSVQCRVKTSLVASNQTGDNFLLPCGRNGLICLNSDQFSSLRCQYYEMSILCPKDFNECANPSLNNCDQNAQCINTFGSYKCVCNSGFSGNGSTCFDVRKCIAWGDPHYVSFDKVTHHFMGVCSYRLTETCFTSPSMATNLKQFKIITANEYRGGNTAVSFAKLVTLNYEGVQIELGENNNLMINGVNFDFPQTLTVNDVTIEITYTTNGMKIQTSFGIDIVYDGQSQITVSVPSSYSGQICGMCGNMNENAIDDWTLSDGTIVNDGVTWGNSWMTTTQNDTVCAKLNSSLPNSMCDTNADKVVTSMCSLLSSLDGPFADCHNRIDPQTIYPSCYFDMCSDPKNTDLLCKAFKMYADNCADIGILLDWRRSTGCVMECGQNQHYEFQTSGCQASCQNPNIHNNCPLSDTSGCVCNDGYLISGSICVPKGQCGCTDDSNKYRSIGDTWLTNNCSVKNTCTGPSKLIKDNHVQCNTYGQCFQDLITSDFKCRCKAGYEGSADNCTDIDECTLNNHACSDVANCNNLEGSYNCTCKTGFTGDGYNCTNVNECQLGTDNCSPYAQCYDTHGSFKCICENGYEGNGVTCAEPLMKLNVTNNLGCSFYADTTCDKLAECYDFPNKTFTCSCIEGTTGDGLLGLNNTGCSYAPCPTNSYAFQGQCYSFVTTSQTYTESETICNNQGAHLASFISPQALNFVKDKLDIFGQKVPLYIGYDSLSYNGIYMPIDFSLVTFQPWAQNHPILTNPCVVILPNNDTEPYKYKSINCSEKHQAICKFPPSPRNCPDGWREVQGKCVTVFQKPRNAIDSALECARFGGDLSTINSQNVSDLLSTRILKLLEGNYWFGLNKDFLQRSVTAQWWNDTDVDYILKTLNTTAAIIQTAPDMECYQLSPSMNTIGAACTDLSQGYLCERPQNIYLRCPLSSEYFNGRCYKPTTVGPQANSSASCIDAGGYLVSIKTYGEQSFIESYLKLNNAVAKYWIGLEESLTVASVYKWQDGSIVEYTNWNDNEPSLSAKGNCVILTPTSNSSLPWAEVSCSSQYKGLCKYLNTPCKNDSDCNAKGHCHMGQCRCNAGFTGDGLNKCDNIDECTINPNLCSTNEVCNDTPGSYTCDCAPDYIRYYNGTCEYKLFCNGDAECAKNGKCFQNICSCNIGYSGDGKLNCTDINECDNFNTTNCSVNATCINTPGSYYCTCMPGYHGSTTGTSCHLIEKNCHEYLMNHPGSLSGLYTLDPDALGPLVPVNMYCEMRPNLGITVVRHDNMVLKQITNPKPLTEKRPITYEIPIPHILKVITSSQFCYQDMQFQCKGYMNLMMTTHYIDALGVEHQRWGASTTENTCGCGELRTCTNLNSPCFCDGSYQDSSYDSGRVINSTILPVIRILTGGNVNGASGSISLGALRCGPKPFDLPVDCDDAKKNFGQTMNDVIWIDVDQDGPLNPFKVMCDVKTKPFGITIVPHDKIPGNSPQTLPDNLPGPLLPPSSPNNPNKTCLKYPTTDDAISKLISNSGGCTQEVKYDCQNGAQLLNNKAYLTTLNDKVIDYFGSGSNGKCACGVLGVCTNANSNCNCDGNNDGTDFGFIRKKSDLPVTCSVDNNPPSSPSKTSVGPLMCGPGPFGLEPSCHEWLKRGYNVSYAYLVDPDGGNIYNKSQTNIPEFLVQCVMNTNPPNGVTKIPSQEQPKNCTGQSNKLCKNPVTYPLTPEQIKPIIDRSAYCTQRITYTCRIMTLLKPYSGNTDPYAFWRTYGRENIAVNNNYFSGNGNIKVTCDCGINASCSRCFCDKSSNDTKIDDGYLTNKLNLPVGAVWIGDDPSQPSVISKIEVGDLECVETFPTCYELLAPKQTTEKIYAYNTYNSLDPDGPLGEGPIIAFCQNGVTIIPAVNVPITIDSTNTSNVGPNVQCPDVIYQYLPSIKQLKALTQQSKSCKQYMKLSCVNTPLTDYVQWYDVDGILRPGWAGNTDGTECACGEVDSCLGGTQYSCNCDSMPSQLTYDHGLLVNKDILPVSKVCLGLYDKTLPKPPIKRKIIIDIGSLMCTQDEKEIQPDCQRLRENQYQDAYRSLDPQSEAWVIDPDSNGPGKPFTVFCDMMVDLPVGVTVLKPALNQSKCNETSLPSEALKLNITYLAAKQDNILRLTSVSSHCEQVITYNCLQAPLFDGTTFGAYDINNNYIAYWLGPNDPQSCLSDTCTCKTNKETPQNNSGKFTDKSILPLTKINLPNVSGSRKLCIKELRCYNLPRTCDEYNQQKRLSSSKGNRNNIWAIDPDQSGGEVYFGVLCVTSGKNIITQVLQNPDTLVSNSQPQPTKPVFVPYTQSNMIQVHNLANVSSYCSQRMDYYCTKTGSLNNGGPMIMDYSNKAITAWAGADRYNVSGGCACSVLGRCPQNKACRCDELSAIKIYEGGLFTNRNILPLQDLVYKSNGTSSTTIYSMQCSTTPFNLPVDCIDAWKKGYLNDTEVLILPAGSTEPFLVYCVMNPPNNNGMQITVIPTNTKAIPMTTQLNILYPTASLDNIRKLVTSSSYCLQAMKVICQGITLSTSFKWTDGTSTIRNDFGTNSKSVFCPCGQQKICARVPGDSTGSMSSRQCNCDISDNSTRVDSNLITTKTQLPFQAIGFTLSNPPSSNLIQISSLMCSNKKFDFDECQTGFHECDINANCTNTDNGYTCQCRSGWNGLGGNEVFSTGRSCIDDNECALNMCPTVSDCTNTPGSFICVCQKGFKQTAPTVCEDIDECATKTSTCDKNANCLNTYGSFICTCKLGYRGTGQSGECNPVATCSCWGDPHCLSFDGSWLHYQGLCTYTLARDNCLNGVPMLTSSPSFEVLMTNWDQNQGYQNQVSWAKELTIKTMNFTIMMKLGLVVTVNGQKTTLPFIPKGEDGSPIGIAVSYYGDNVRMTTPSGVEIKWDGISRVDVTVGGGMSQQMCGLCGNYNYRSNDDWVIGPQCNGTGQQTTLLNLYGDSWRSDDVDSDQSTCPQTTCRESPNEEACAANLLTQAQLECNKLATIFAKCAASMVTVGRRIQNYIDSCVYDYCRTTGDSSAMICRTAESLASMCNEQYKVTVNFRSQNFCAMNCSRNMVYSTCASPCQPTCVNKMSLTLCNTECVEGCFCKEGYVMENGTCILPSQCGCLMADGTYFQNGEKRTNDNCSETCSCNRQTGQLECANIQCSNDAFCGFKDDDFNCHCKKGFMGDGLNCTDIDECLLKPLVCDVNAICDNSPGSYSCACKEGFAGDGVKCTNINECSPTSPCDKAVEDCFDKIPGYDCICKAGFMRNTTSGNCEDKNECLDTGNQCERVSTTCNNTFGSYRCDCKYGFRPNPVDSFVCTDVDECHLVHDCDKNFAKCTNTPGSYYCTCYYGYQGDGINCTDINECVAEKVCQRPDSTCVNLPGSYKCLCADGKPGCDGPNPCDNVTCTIPHELCYMGQCNCEHGYLRNETTKSCVDIDECSTGNNDCAGRLAQCVNEAGSYRCSCLYGYQMSSNDSCENIDECTSRLHRCGSYADCIDTDGGYYCQCKNGFTGHCDECRDIDECAIGENSCDKTFANCFNSIGSYRCECKDGFFGDGSRCGDVDECSSGFNNCTDPKSYCQNSVGGYTCLCTSGYQYNVNGKCSDINECMYADNGCDVNADCQNMEGFYKCTCKEGFNGNGTNCTPEDGKILCNQILCPFNSECVNSTCICKKGFKQSENSCIDDNECTSDTVCDINADCLNIHGTYKCHCRDGFLGNGHYCFNKTSGTDVCKIPNYCQDGNCYDGACHCSDGYILKDDRCYDNRCNNACPSTAICSTSTGSAVCTCPSGTSMSSNESLCVDIDECSDNFDDCQDNSLCQNIYGSYKCVCPPGYLDVFGDGKICQDSPPSNCNLTCPSGQYCKDSECACLKGLNQKNENGVTICNKETPSCTENTCPPNSVCEDRLFGFLCHCTPGYEAVGLKSCKDTDECNRNLHNCSNNEICSNAPGSFKCSCKPEYTRDNSSSVCIVPRKCNCEPNGVCNSDGICDCNPGFQLNNGGECEDVDECLTESPCHLLANCYNTPGSYNCSCPMDYYGDPYTRCIEDRCATKQLICAKEENCTRGIYSSVCIKKICQSDQVMIGGQCVFTTKACQSKVCKANAVCKVTNGRADCFCDSGFTGDGDSCTDIDECAVDSTICPSNSRCQNKQGSYHCTCDPGFVKSESNSSSGICVDIVECDVPNACAYNANCKNTIGSFLCTCREGYIGDGRFNCHLDAKCEKYGKCNENAACLLNPDTSIYQCNCNSGYSGDGINTCIKDNVCFTDGHTQCHPNATCVPDNSTYHCDCKTGFQGDGYNVCNDINECESPNGTPCSAVETCVNLPGGFKCICGDGAQIVDDLCQDIDECNGTGLSKCSTNAYCNNSIKSHTCTCKDGFYGDGITCQDIDECKFGIANCSLNALCINKPGSFDCQCQAGTSGNGTSCVDEDECSLPKNNTNAALCDENAKCKDKNPGYECECNEGFVGTGFFCVKSNPCNKPNVCNVNQTCSPSDKNNAVTCKCKDDFDSINGTCVPIQACVTGQDTCDKNSENCLQLERGFTCECQPGFKKVDDKCEDKNECDPKSPDFAAQPCAASGGGCVNTPGSFICTCSKEQAEGPGGCSSINPCATNLNTCDKNIENCVNIGNSSFSCQCNPGFAKINGSCKDINECSNKLDNCRNNATCVNTIGSYNCTCPSTMKLDDSKMSCKDLDECVENPLICGNFSKCVNTEASFKCECINGFEWNGTSCNDIDECKNLTNPCHEYAICSNVPGSCTCRCRPGYNGDGRYRCTETDECPPNIQVSCFDGTYCTYKNGVASCECKTGYTFIDTISCNDTVCLKQCNDVDECITKKSACHPLAKCTNSNGAYACQCPSNLKGDGKTICEDKDECALGEHMCDLNTSICINNDNIKNILKPFECQCLTGYIKLPGTELCIDKNECLNPADNNCPKNSQCFDTDGSYECICLKGFKSAPGGNCIDVNECAEISYTCDLHSRCNNTIGDYDCICDSGYQPSLNSSIICEDIDECGNPFTCRNIPDSKCINNAGSFECVCSDGFISEGGVCIDKNECLNPSSCKNGSICFNEQGSFRCECPSMKRQLPDGSCEDINECLESTDQCKDLNGPNSTCYDLPVGYGCVCPPGFVAGAETPMQCTDMDECSLHIDDCTVGSSTCVNTYGGFRCKCKLGYTLTDDRKCEDVDECNMNTTAGKNICKNGTCINIPGGYRCECHAGFQLSNNRCLDIDECNINRNSHLADTCDDDNGYCTNTPGSYKCSCKKGYQMSDNSSKCQDIDECSYENSCLNGLCINNDGSFECICLTGYQNVNGKCVDIDECLKDPALCGNPSTGVCLNTIGSYKCYCNQGYDNSGGKITNECVPVNECVKLNVTCPPNSECMDQVLGYQCQCQDGYQEDQIGLCRNINECQIEASCHPFANCIDNEGSFDCRCRPGYKGDGKTTCTSICGPNSCPETQICKIVNGDQFECGCSCQGDQCSTTGPVCDKSGVTFSSERLMFETACKQNRTTEIDYFHECKSSCNKVKCPNTEICTMVDGKPTCSCINCTEQDSKPNVLCSNNGIQFDSICHMKKWICETKALIIKSYDGPCRRPIDCELTYWSDWTECSKTCGVGSSQRTRTVIREARFNGRCDYATLETKSCFNGPCPGDACENMTCPIGAMCDYGKCMCPDCSGLTTTEPVCGKIGDKEAGSYRTFCTLEHNACMYNTPFTYIHKGYCGEHVPSEPKICTVVTDFQIVNDANNCTSVEPVRTNVCLGGCGLRPEYCCRPLTSTILRVKFMCPDNSFVFSEVKSINSCECKLEETSTKPT